MMAAGWILLSFHSLHVDFRGVQLLRSVYAGLRHLRKKVCATSVDILLPESHRIVIALVCNSCDQCMLA
jgi:hypothetical protein